MLALASCSHCLAADAPAAFRVLPARQTSAKPTIDGRLGDPCWREASRADGFTDTTRQVLAEEQTEALICYDDEAIYVGFRCTDSRASEIIGRETVRDSQFGESGSSEDSVDFALDPFLSHKWEDVSRFRVNPIGTRSARIGGGRGAKAEWSGDWSGASQRSEDGWTAEMRIPWSLLSYPQSRKPVTMGVNFMRTQYRTRVRSQWSDLGTMDFLERQGRWEGVEPPVTFRPSVSALQYVLAGLSDGRANLRSGLDTRLTLTPELTGVVSANPDFATVEGAVESIAFTRGEPLIEERRPFFIEGSSYVSLETVSAIGRYFHSMRIPTFDLGAKLYGKVGQSDTIGLLATTAYPGRSDVVGRVRHDLTPVAQVTGMVQLRRSEGAENSAALLVGEQRSGKYMLTLQTGFTGGPGAGGRMAQGGIIYLDRTLVLGLIGFGMDDRFLLPHGFIPFTGIKGGIAIVQNWAEWRTGPWRGYMLSGEGGYQMRSSGVPFQRGVGFRFGMDTRSDYGFNLNVNHWRFEDQWDSTIGIWVGKSVSDRFNKIGLYVSSGALGGAHSTFVGPSINVRLRKRLDIGLSGAYQSRAGVNQQYILTANYEMSPTRSVGGRLVVTNGKANGYASYRNSGGKGLETYVILGDPNAATFRSQALVKLVKPW